MGFGDDVQQAIGDASPWDEALTFATKVWTDLRAEWWGLPALLVLAGIWIWRHKR